MSTEPKSTARRDKTDEWDFRKPVSTEPKRRTCQTRPQLHFRNDIPPHKCVNWREGESTAAQPLVTCDYSTNPHNLATRYGYECVNPRPCVDCGQPESDKAHDPDCPSSVHRHKFEAIPPAAETAMTAEYSAFNAWADIYIEQLMEHKPSRKQIARDAWKAGAAHVREAAQGKIERLIADWYKIWTEKCDKAVVLRAKLAELEKALGGLLAVTEKRGDAAKFLAVGKAEAVLASLRAESKELVD